VGHQIARDAAPTKVLLELGSNSALVVAEDADIAAAADAVVRGGYYASGQACISVQRVIVVESVRADFEAALNERLQHVVIGDPRSPDTRISKLIDDRSTARVRDWIGQAHAAGAGVATGGQAADGIVGPVMLIDVPDGQPAWDEEIFGPVIAIRSVADIAEAFRTVNASRYGLHASVFTSSLETAFAAIDQLDVGGVVVNEVPGFRSDVMPYGGVKDSGTGREGPRFAIEELTTTRMAIIRPRPAKG
jgi:acyl-CoA reductase-like NAD-dependent aldehyde dehydrogenase